MACSSHGATACSGSLSRAPSAGQRLFAQHPAAVDGDLFAKHAHERFEAADIDVIQPFGELRVDDTHFRAAVAHDVLERRPFRRC